MGITLRGEPDIMAVKNRFCTKVNGSYFVVSKEELEDLKAGKVPQVYSWCGDTVEYVDENEFRVYFKQKESDISERIVEATVSQALHKPDEHEGYEDLARILNMAYEQATSGKGKERHANGRPFNRQPIMEIGRMTGLAYHTGQAMKKIQEAHKLLKIKGKDAAIRELLGAEVYIAAAIKLIEEMEDHEIGCRN